MIQVTINGHTYNSISQAWRNESPPGLPMVTVRWRLNNEWNTYDAFCYPPVIAEDRRRFKNLRNS